MPMLLIDRGNTQLKWQLRRLEKVLASGSCKKAESLDEAFKGLDYKVVSSVFVASVANEAFEKELATWFSINKLPKPQFIKSPQSACNVMNGYDEPKQLGVDRWLAFVAAHHQFEGALCVVDAGTALTMDFVLSNGQHLGGYIVPGYDLLISTLLKNTEQIVVDQQNSGKLLGTNTSQAVMWGVTSMLTAFLQQKIMQMEAELSTPIKLVMTGGGAEGLLPMIEHQFVLAENLVFDGLVLMANEIV